MGLLRILSTSARDPYLNAPLKEAAYAASIMAQRAVIRLQLDIAAKQQLDKLCAKRGMTQIAVLSRVVKWFGRQDELVQASVLGLLSDEMLGQLAPKLLGQMSDAGAAKSRQSK